MEASHHHAEGLQNLNFNFALSVKYFSKFRQNSLRFLERKLCSVPSFCFAYGCTETNLQHTFRQSGEKGNSHYHILVSAGENFINELAEIVSGVIDISERVVLVKLKSTTSETGFQDHQISVASTKITASGSEYFVEKPIDIICCGKYFFKAASRGIVTFYFKKHRQ